MNGKLRSVIEDTTERWREAFGVEQTEIGALDGRAGR
jgi:hypothetical protein